MAVRIGELLLKEKRITPEQLQEALNYQRQNGGKLGFNLVKLGYVKDEEITSLLSKQYGVPSINLSQFEIDPAIVKLIPPETAQKYQIVPLSRAGATFVLRGNLAPHGCVIKPTCAEPRLLRHAGPAVVFKDYADLKARIETEDGLERLGRVSMVLDAGVIFGVVLAIVNRGALGT